VIDFYALKANLVSVILRQFQKTDIGLDPTSWAWLVYGIGLAGLDHNLTLHRALQDGQKWLYLESTWSSDATLGAIGLLNAVLNQIGHSETDDTAIRVATQMDRAMKQDITKFSRLNEPETVYGLVIGFYGTMNATLQQQLREHCQRNTTSGSWRRNALFAASSDIAGSRLAPITIDTSTLAPNDLIPLIWLAETRPKLFKHDSATEELWNVFDQSSSTIYLELDNDASEYQFPASTIDVVMLFESVISYARHASPQMLYDNFPWHPEVRKVTQSLFTKGEFVMAVFQAGVLFIDAVKKRSAFPIGKDGRPLDGVSLMDSVFLAKLPLLKFTDMSDQTAQNEHRGLGLIAQGIVSALRNPKGHAPHVHIKLDPFEAIEQLATISYLMRRLDDAI
jgi:uncharacterized protein (TIGR02391 family)